MNQKLAKWQTWIDSIYPQIVELVTNRHTFSSKIAATIRNNPNIQKPNSFYLFIGQTYFDYATMTIRRQIKPQRASISFVGLLKEIREHPCILSRKRFVDSYPLCLRDDANCIFDEKFIGRCTDHLDPNLVQQDIEELKVHRNKLEEFTDRRVAHHDKRPPQNLPTFSELDACINCLEKLIRKYFLLIKTEDPGEDLTAKFVKDYWHEIFNQPWILADESERFT